MRLIGDRAPFAVGSGAAERENEAMLTRDGRWLAFVSRQSGADEVYLAPFPKGGRRRVSVGGGGEPRWRGDDAELYYLTPDGALVAAPIHGKDQIEPGTPVPLFRPCNGLRLQAGAYSYDVTPDGSRFLAICASPASNPSAITVSLDWMTSVK